MIAKSFMRQPLLVVRVEGLEPSRREAPDPKSGASAIPPHSQVPFYFTMLSSYWSNKKIWYHISIHIIKEACYVITKGIEI